MPQPPHADVRGFLPDDEGLQLYEWALAATAAGPLLEVGSYCGRSTIWLGQAAQARQNRGIRNRPSPRFPRSIKSERATMMPSWLVQKEYSIPLPRFVAISPKLSSSRSSFPSSPEVHSSPPTGRAHSAW